MPFMILYGGELVFMFLGVRVVRWMWRSRENVVALWRSRNGTQPSGPSFEPDPIAASAPPAISQAPRVTREIRARGLQPLRRAA